MPRTTKASKDATGPKNKEKGNPPKLTVRPIQIGDESLMYLSAIYRSLGLDEKIAFKTQCDVMSNFLEAQDLGALQLNAALRMYAETFYECQIAGAVEGIFKITGGQVPSAFEPIFKPIIEKEEALRELGASYATAKQTIIKYAATDGKVTINSTFQEVSCKGKPNKVYQNCQKAVAILNYPNEKACKDIKDEKLKDAMKDYTKKSTQIQAKTRKFTCDQSASMQDFLMGVVKNKAEELRGERQQQQCIRGLASATNGGSHKKSTTLHAPSASRLTASRLTASPAGRYFG